VQTVKDIAPAFQSIMAAVIEGRITPGEGSSLAEVLSSHVRVVSLVEIEQRKWKLEDSKSLGPRYWEEREALRRPDANEETA
jgi:hypothetical protein